MSKNQLTELLSTFGKDGKQFEALTKWYLEQTNEYKSVFLWNDWGGRWGVDCGIDIVAETFDGKLVAVQAKNYAEAYYVTTPDVHSFLTESSRKAEGSELPAFFRRLLVMSTNKIGANAEASRRNQAVPCDIINLSDLLASGVDWSQFGNGKKAVRTPHELRPHQVEAMDKVLKGFTEYDRGIVVLPCGTGKSLLAQRVAESVGGSILVLVPSLDLLKQTRNGWNANRTDDFASLAVCSDSSVINKKVDGELCVADLGFPVTTDPDQISKFLKSETPGMKVVFSTYQSSPQLVEFKFDLAIADEAHRCAGQVDSVTTTIIHGVQADRRLFMTATPRFVRGRDGDEVVSMDDMTSFGPVIHTLSFAEAVERGLLCDYEVIVTIVRESLYGRWVDEGVFVRYGEGAATAVTDARTLAGQIGVALAIQKYELRKVVTFHGRITAAAEFSRTFPQLINWLPDNMKDSDLRFHNQFVSGETPAGKRDDAILAFEHFDGCSILSNSRVLGEGVDVPGIDAVAFIDPKRSVIDITQAVGRASRVAPGKTLGRIIIALVVDDGEIVEDILEDSVFQPVWDVLRALRSHNEITPETAALQYSTGLRSATRRAPRVPVVRLIGAEDITVEFAEAFESRVAYTLTGGNKTLEESLGLLQVYADREGHTLVPTNHIEDGYGLGAWVGGVRCKKGRGELSEEHATLFESYPGWAWNRRDASLEKGFENLVLFVDREGHARVPYSHVEGDYRLGLWVANRRSAKGGGKISAELVARFESYPGWVWNIDDDALEKCFEVLGVFVDREGHARVPSKHIEGDYRLGQWVGTQRSAKGGGKMSAELVARFESYPGWVWNLDGAYLERGFENLDLFTGREGHALVPSNHVEGDYPLGQWATSRRSDMVRGILSAERVARFESYPGWVWSLLGADLEKGFESLDIFTGREGHARVPSSHVEGGYPLGRFVVSRRRSRVKGRMSTELVARFESYPGWVWNTFDADLDGGFEKLGLFTDREGHSCVPQGWVEDGYFLGVWVSSQRRKKVRGKMSEELVTRFESCRGWVWDARVSR